MIQVDLYKRFKDMPLQDKMITTRLMSEISSGKELSSENKVNFKALLSRNKVSERGLL